jgi:cell division inhibitor SulA
VCIVPSIALSGEWLRRAGFPPGARVLIMVQCAGQLIIDRLR